MCFGDAFVYAVAGGALVLVSPALILCCGACGKKVFFQLFCVRRCFCIR